MNKKLIKENGRQVERLQPRYTSTKNKVDTSYRGRGIVYQPCPECGFDTLAVLEQGYSFVLYLCDACGAKVEEAL